MYAIEKSIPLPCPRRRKRRYPALVLQHSRRITAECFEWVYDVPATEALPDGFRLPGSAERWRHDNG